MLYKMLDECGKQLENDYKEKGEYTEDIFSVCLGQNKMVIKSAFSML